VDRRLPELAAVIELERTARTFFLSAAGMKLEHKHKTAKVAGAFGTE